MIECSSHLTKRSSILLLLAIMPALYAADYTGVAPLGNWSTAANWNTANVPDTGGESGFVNAGRSADISSNLGTAGSRLVDVNAGGNQGGLGGNGFIQHTSGDVYVDWFRVGRGADRAGTYKQDGGLVNANRFYVGGENDTGTGSYTLNGGAIVANTDFRVGEINGGSGTSRGTFIMNNGTITSAPSIQVGLRSGGAGTANGVFTLNGGVVNAPQLNVGVNSQTFGTFNQTAGTLNISGNGFRHAQNGGTAVINLSGGTMNQPGGDTVYGENSGGNATVNHSGTHVSNSNQTWVGYNGSRGTYNMSNGTLRLTGGEGLMVGRQAGGTGIFDKTGGTISATGALQVGRNNARGTFTQSDGVMTFGSASIGNEASASGVLNISGGTANLGGTAIGSASGAGTLNHSGGNLNVNGDWFEIAQGNGGTGVLNLSGGTINHNGLQRTIIGTRGNATATVSGTGRLNAGYLHVGGSYESQTITVGMNQSGGTVTTSTLQVGGGNATTAYNLEGGALRFATLNAFGNGSTQLNWGSGRIAPRQSDAGSATGADLSSGTGFTQVRNSTTTFITNANLTTGSGTGQASTLDLGGLYLSAGNVLFDHLVVGAGRTLALSSTSDVLEFDDDTVYLLRPFGFNTEDYGSMPLVTTTGGGLITGTFDTFYGLADDGRGFSQFTGAFSSAAALPSNTWYLEQTGSGITFHYKVGGVVPEPDTFVLLALSVIGLRTGRTLRERRRQVGATLED